MDPALRGRLGRFSACALLFLGAVALSACESPFSPPTLVEKLRILGIQAEPPAISWEALESTTSVGLRALVGDPHGEGRTLGYRWALCWLTLDRSARDIDCPGPGDFLLGEGSTAEIPLGELRAWAAELGAGVDLSAVEPDSSFPLFVGLEVTADQERVRALKRIEVGGSAEEEPNINPRLVGLEVNGQAVDEASAVWPEGEKIELTPVVDTTSRQTYRREGEAEQREEDFLFSWFATAGKFADRRTIWEIDPKGNRLDQTEWTRPDAGLQGPLTLWVVLRDGRYGEDWLERTFELSNF